MVELSPEPKAGKEGSALELLRFCWLLVDFDQLVVVAVGFDIGQIDAVFDIVQIDAVFDTVQIVVVFDIDQLLVVAEHNDQHVAVLGFDQLAVIYIELHFVVERNCS